MKEELIELRRFIQLSLDQSFLLEDMISDNLNIQGPIIVHQRLCQELMNVAKEHPKTTPELLPKGKEILISINMLEELYPELKNI